MKEDIVIRLIDAIHTETAFDDLALLLREAAQEIQDIRLYLAFPPVGIDSDAKLAEFPDIKGNG